jgi:CheY-like chemotaxis protein
MAVETHPKVLVVDDVEDWQLTLRGLLRKIGCDVILAGSLVEARDALRNDKIDLAVLDMRLDERDEANKEGLDLAEEIQTQWPNTKVIIATGYSTQEVLQRAWEPAEGHQRLVADFIPKNEIDSLIGKVKKILHLGG